MVNQPPFVSKCLSPNSFNDKIFSKFEELLTRLRTIPNEHEVTHFHSPFKPVQANGRRVPLHLLAGVTEELKRMETEGHIIKLEKCDEDCFISPILITRKKDGSIKLALDSKILNNQICKNKYQMPEKSNGEVWFRNLDPKNAYSQLKFGDQTSKQCNFSVVGGETTGTYQFLLDFVEWETCPRNPTGHGITFKEHTVHKLFYRQLSGSFEGIVGKT